MNLKIAWLYHDILNIYGDRGNLLAFKYRCQKRGIKTSIDKVSLNNPLKEAYYDFIFSGGGQDKQQILAAADLKKKKKALMAYADNNIPMLLICGSYQLFGHYFLTFDKKKIPGISIFNAFTQASKIRKINNVTVKINPSINKLINNKMSDKLVGFENHSGNTFITSLNKQKNKVKTIPLGKVIKGAGNNGQDKTEGAVYKHVFGTYLHGSLLPKNPHFTDFLIKLALKNRYHREIKLKKLQDNIEWLAHQSSLKLKR